LHGVNPAAIIAGTLFEAWPMAFIDHDKASLYYQVVGEGPAITFAHGAGGNAASWFQQVPYFYNDYKTLCFDHRAFGRSRCLEEDFSTDRFADDLKAILDDAGISRTALVCQSLGGWTGITFSLKYPEMVSCLVMSHTTGGITNERIKSATSAAAAKRAPLTSPFDSWAVAADLAEKDPVKANLYNQIGAFNVTINFSKMLSGRGGPRVGTTADDLASFEVPTLFITADMDVVIPPEAVHEAATLVRNSETASFQGIGHSSYFEAPTLFNETVNEFLKRHVNEN
jgi:3-oxoadipate enol-lactonase